MIYRRFLISGEISFFHFYGKGAISTSRYIGLRNRCIDKAICHLCKLSLYSYHVNSEKGVILVTWARFFPKWTWVTNKISIIAIKIAENTDHREAATGSVLQKEFCGVLKNFTILTEKHLCFGFFLIKLRAWKHLLFYRAAHVAVSYSNNEFEAPPPALKRM